MNETRSRIAFLGIGLMGSPQARNILKAGFALTAWNRSAAKADALVQFGAGVAATPADAARTADVVILMLENGPIVERVLFGSDMVVAMRPGTIVVDMSSIKPAEAKAHARRLAARGIAHIDAPVSVDAIDIPVMIQDAPVAGTPLPVALLARIARETSNVRYFKVEVPMAAAKLRNLIAAGGDAIEGPGDGEEAITLMADLDAGATGAMTGGGYPDGIRQIIDPFVAGRRDDAMAAYARWLPLINYENRQCGLHACKALMREGGVIGSEAVRHPLQPLHPSTRAGLIEIARRLDPLVLRWGQ